MQPSSYGVDSSKGAANINNPYDFKNVQVRKLKENLKLHIKLNLFYFLILLKFN
jgi:hypothetical protein